MNLCTRLQWLNEFTPFAATWSSWYLCGTPSNRILKDSSASTIQAYLVLVPPLQFTGVLQGIAAGIGTSNFLRAFFMILLNSSSSGSMKKISRNCLVISSFGVSRAHFCFALLFAASDICFHISGHTLPGLEVVCFLVSLHPDHVYPLGGLSFNKMNLVKPVHASDNSLSPSTSQSSSIFSPTIHPVTFVLFWQRRCTSEE